MALFFLSSPHIASTRPYRPAAASGAGGHNGRTGSRGMCDLSALYNAAGNDSMSRRSFPVPYSHLSCHNIVAYLSLGCNKIVAYSRGENMHFQRLEDLRIDADKTQAEIADVLHCKREVYRRYEKGIYEIPAWALIELAKYYGTTTDYILGLTDER